MDVREFQVTSHLSELFQLLEVLGCYGADRGNSAVSDGVQCTLCHPKSKTRLKTLSSGEVKNLGNYKFVSY